MSNLTKEEMVKQIKYLDEAINAGKQLKDETLKEVTKSKTTMDIAINELKKHNTTPENAEEKIKQLTKEANDLLKEIEDCVPIDLLKELNKIQ